TYSLQIPIPIETRSLPALARSYPRHFTFYVTDPISSIETQSLPSLLHCYPRSFTFYLGNPFPRLQAADVATSSKNDSRDWRGVGYSRSVATGGSARVATGQRRGGTGA